MIVHGTVVLLWRLVAGVPFLRAIVTESPARRAEAWRAAHTGLSGTGVMVIAMGTTLLAWDAPSALGTFTAWAVVVGAYGIAVAMTLAAITGARGLVGGGNAANRIVWGAYMVGVPATLLGTGGFLWLALQQTASP